MLSRWPIRYKLTLGLVLLLVIVLTMAVSAFQGAYAYRGLIKSITRTSELPLAQHVGDLRVTLSQTRRLQDDFLTATEAPPVELHILREQFRTQFQAVRDTLEHYDSQLVARQLLGQSKGEYRRERGTVRKLKQSLRVIDELNRHEDWILDSATVAQLNVETAVLQRLSGELTGYLRERLTNFSADVRTKYRVWIGLTWLTCVTAGVMLAGLLFFFWKWIFLPLRIVIQGSRRVARGDFNHRIHLPAQDEMADLATALNDMTQRFQTIRDDLDEQVKQRTRQVVRSERMASVGFLAAGVAHEINNPLASVAFCAESLTERVEELFASEEELDEGVQEEVGVIKTYLRMIEDEAFRCKDITEKLLDFSRMGDVERQDTELTELVQGVIDMIRHLGKYREKNIVFAPTSCVVAPVCPQEIKQVVLNLIANALDALDPGGEVQVELHTSDKEAELTVTDNGCGMNEKILEHVFEPFYTRRRGGQGTGLGLAITYRIVADHGGDIEATSDGPGKGSRFHVKLPLVQYEQERQIQDKAA